MSVKSSNIILEEKIISILNLFLANFFNLYPLKTSGNQGFMVFSGGSKMGILAENGLKNTLLFIVGLLK